VADAAAPAQGPRLARDNRFTPVQALKAELGGGIWLRTSV